MNIEIGGPQRNRVNKKDISRQVKLVFKTAKKPQADYQLSIALVDNQTIKRLNRQYRNKNKPTTILSFVYSKTAGEIILSIPEIRKKSREIGMNWQKFFCRILIHGLLHLCGYRHSNQEQTKQMEKMEEKILNELQCL